LVSALCKRTLGALKNQSLTDWECVLVCNRRPEGLEEDQNIAILEESFAVPGSHQESMRDKGRKKNRGLEETNLSATRYMMALDADDLLHRDFVATLAQRPRSLGWIVRRGYEYDGGTWVVRRNGNFNFWCGSCSVIAAAELDRSPEPWRMPHDQVEEHFRSKGQALPSMPGYPVVHVLATGENQSGDRRAIDIRSVRRGVAALKRVRPVTPNFRRAFNLFPV
jgi:hypothetical protein